MQKQTKLSGQLEKLLSQINQVKQSYRQVKQRSDRAGLTSLSPEALYKACALLLAVPIPYFKLQGNKTQTSSAISGTKAHPAFLQLSILDALGCLKMEIWRPVRILVMTDMTQFA